jgi:hypothetical protein
VSLRRETCNADFARGGNKKLIEELCANNDVVTLYECYDFNVKSFLPPGWEAYQETGDEARKNGRSNVAIMWDTTRANCFDIKLRRGVEPFINGRRVKMRTRWIGTAKTLELANRERSFDIWAHISPQRYAALQWPMMRKIKNIAKNHPASVLGADVNMNLQKAANFLGMRLAAGSKPVGIFVGPALKVEHAATSTRLKRAGLIDHATGRVTTSRRTNWTNPENKTGKKWRNS